MTTVGLWPLAVSLVSLMYFGIIFLTAVLWYRGPRSDARAHEYNNTEQHELQYVFFVFEIALGFVSESGSVSVSEPDG